MADNANAEENEKNIEMWKIKKLIKNLMEVLTKGPSLESLQAARR
jgi:hypothetical protein